MSWNIIEEEWEEVSTDLRARFPLLSEEDLQEIDGQPHLLTVKLREIYDVSTEAAQDMVRSFSASAEIDRIDWNDPQAPFGNDFVTS